MILKALKILPVMVSAAAQPILDTPKKAAEPINTWNYNQEMYQDDSYSYTQGQTKQIVTKWKTSGNQQTWGNQYATYEQTYYAQTSYYYKDGYTYLYLGMGGKGKTSQLCQSMYCLSIKNTDGWQKVNLTHFNQIDLYGILNIPASHPLTFKYDTQIYVTNNDEAENFMQWEVDQDQTLGDVTSEIRQTYTIQKIYENTNTFSAAQVHRTEYIEQDLENYILNKQQNYYFFFITNLYRVDDRIAATDTGQVFKPYDNEDEPYPMTIEQNLYNVNVTQEVIDIPDIMFTVLTMPFSFVTQAFDLTLFPGTNYSVNISTLLLSLLAILVFAFIMKVVISKLS